MLLELTKGVALLLALCLVESVIRRHVRDNAVLRDILLGLLFGGICVFGMMTPIRFAEGIIFDARSAIIATSGLFGGPLVGGIAAAIAGGFRFYLGGAGMPVGVATIAVSVGLGLVYRYLWQHRGWPVSPIALLTFGAVLHVVCVGLFMFLPEAIADRLLRELALPYVLVFAPATMLIGLLFVDTQKRLAMERELAQRTKKLEELQGWYSAAFDHSPNAVTLKRRDGRYLIVNKTFARWQNMTPEEVTGKTLLDLVPEDQAGELIEQDRKVIDEGVVWTGEGRRDFADGVTRFVKATKVPVALGPDRLDALVTILMDISSEKRAEAQVIKARDEAVAANRTKSEFLARMSHEFRTPLNAILGFADILANDHIAGLSQQQRRDYATDIHGSAEMLLELVNDLLDIAAIEQGRIPLAMESLDVGDIVEESIRILNARIDAKGLSVTADIADNIPCIVADRRSLKQILLNLLTNALKFTNAGGHIAVSAAANAGGVEIVVSDDGIGIAPDKRETLLAGSPLTAAGSHKTESGWGLGLAIVRGLTELHGGNIDIESELGSGTSLYVRLPFDGAAAARTAPAAD